jgi:hypothetical protein
LSFKGIGLKGLIHVAVHKEEELKELPIAVAVQKAF